MSDKRFQKWLDVIVKDGLMCDKRKSCIHRFTRALCNFIIKNGYAIEISEPYLRNCIATGLFENSKKSHIASEWNYSDVNTEYSEEEFIHYNFIFDSEAWEKFWLMEGWWGDVHPDNLYGEDRRLDIQNFIWKQICLSESPQTEELHEILTGGEEEITTPWSTNGDVYLQETVEYNGWGGLRR